MHLVTSSWGVESAPRSLPVAMTSSYYIFPINPAPVPCAPEIVPRWPSPGARSRRSLRGRPPPMQRRFTLTRGHRPLGPPRGPLGTGNSDREPRKEDVRDVRGDSRTSVRNSYGQNQASWTPSSILGCVSSGYGESRELLSSSGTDSRKCPINGFPTSKSAADHFFGHKPHKT